MSKYHYIKCNLPDDICQVWDLYCIKKGVQPKDILIPVMQKFVNGELSVHELPYFKYTNTRKPFTDRRINIPKAFSYTLKTKLESMEIQHAGFMRVIIEHILIKEGKL